LITKYLSIITLYTLPVTIATVEAPLPESGVLNNLARSAQPLRPDQPRQLEFREFESNHCTREIVTDCLRVSERSSRGQNSVANQRNLGNLIAHLIGHNSRIDGNSRDCPGTT
jgi:hypothetical protein